MSKNAQKKKGKNQDKERLEELTKQFEEEFDNECRLYKIGFRNDDRFYVIRLINSHNIEELFQDFSYEKVKLLILTKLHEADVLKQVSFQSFTLLINIMFKLLDSQKERNKRQLYEIEVCLNCIATILLNSVYLSPSYFERFGLEAKEGYISDNIESPNTIRNKQEKGYYNELLQDYDNEHIELFNKEDNRFNRLTFVGLTDQFAKWFEFYSKCFNEQDNQCDKEFAYSLIRNSFFKFGSVFHAYLTGTKSIKVITETKIVDQPRLFSEQTSSSVFPLKNITNCLFKMNNNLLVIENDKPETDKEEDIPKEEEDKWLGLDTETIETIKNKLEQIKAEKEEEFIKIKEEKEAQKKNVKKKKK